jgi:NADPH:quinone reductase-like Zn-dependent oxidoreductase
VKAAAFEKTGPHEKVRYMDVPDPVVGPGDVLIRVEACAVNHSDLDSVREKSRWVFPLPWVLGAEFAGTVEAVGGEVRATRPGALVTALLQYNCGTCERCVNWRPDLCPHLKIFGTDVWGGYGEFVVVPERAVVPLQPGDDLLAVAGGQCVVSTAWHMVNRLAGVRHGDVVLVPSASGGVGTALVQCAKLAGAAVVATTSTEQKADLIRSLGADEVILRGAEGYASELRKPTGGRGFDAVLDHASGRHFGAHLEALRDDGALVTCGAHAQEKIQLDVVKLFQHGWRILGFRIAPPGELRASLEFIRSGVIKVPVDRTFPLREAADAHEYLDQQKHVGKVLLVADSR